MATSAKSREEPRRSGVRGPANTQALLDAARRLVLEKGSNFTTQDLIQEADVALQTFYRHFGSKDQILLAVVGDMVAGYCDSLAERGAQLDDPVQRLHLYVTDALGVLSGSAAAGAQFMTSQHWRLHQSHPDELAEATRPFADLVQAELEAGLEAGLLSPRSPEDDAWLINKLVMSVFHHYAYSNAEPDEAVAEKVWGFCLAAVGGEVTPTD